MNVMTDLDRIRAILEQERSTQGFNAVPVYLNRAGYSGIAMEREVGVRYSGFAIRYQRGWAEYSYVVADFERIWRVLAQRWLSDPAYFVNLKRAYDERFATYFDLLRRDLSDRLRRASDDELMTLLDRARRAMVDVGISAHATEAISWGADRELRQALSENGLTGREIDQRVAALTLPDEPSWVTKEQQALDAIRSLPVADRTSALERHLDSWYWISNSYAGRQQITVHNLKQRLERVSQPVDQGDAVAPKYRYLGGRPSNGTFENLSDQARRLVRLLQFITTWHDERKAKVLRAIDELGRVLDELAQRLRMNRSALDYLTVNELDRIGSLEDVAPLLPQLRERIAGVWSLIDETGDTALAGAEFDAVDALHQKLETNVEHATKLHGQTAQVGKVEGVVAICLGLDAIANFPEGAVLVTSMTRPEFMPAIKKAVAIVTDEGGITCHAAIVARELGTPCIIGTKVATKLLRDGELIEVNANHGIVRRQGSLNNAATIN